MSELVEIAGQLIDPRAVGHVEPHFTQQGRTVIHFLGGYSRTVQIPYETVRDLLTEEAS